MTKQQQMQYCQLRNSLEGGNPERGLDWKDLYKEIILQAGLSPII